MNKRQLTINAPNNVNMYVGDIQNISIEVTGGSGKYDYFYFVIPQHFQDFNYLLLDKYLEFNATSPDILTLYALAPSTSVFKLIIIAMDASKFFLRAEKSIMVTIQPYPCTNDTTAIVNQQTSINLRSITGTQPPGQGALLNFNAITGTQPPGHGALLNFNAITLPPGLTLNNGIISGIPTSTGTFTIDYTITVNSPKPYIWNPNYSQKCSFVLTVTYPPLTCSFPQSPFTFTPNITHLIPIIPIISGGSGNYTCTYDNSGIDGVVVVVPTSSPCVQEYSYHPNVKNATGHVILTVTDQTTNYTSQCTLIINVVST